MCIERFHNLVNAEAASGPTPDQAPEFEKFLKGFLWKIEAGGNILKGFPFKFTTCLVLHVLHFIWNFFYNPRASLARAAFKRDFLVKLKAISFF